jgi:hypothetical protein
MLKVTIVIDTVCQFCRTQMIIIEENSIPEVIKYFCPKCRIKKFYSIKSI